MPLPMRNPGPVPADTYFLGPQESSPQIESRNDGWRRGVLVSGVRRLNEANTSGPVSTWMGNKPTRSTQPCIPPGSLNRVPASAGVSAAMSPLPGGR